MGTNTKNTAMAEFREHFANISKERDMAIKAADLMSLLLKVNRTLPTLSSEPNMEHMRGLVSILSECGQVAESMGEHGEVFLESFGKIKDECSVQDAGKAMYTEALAAFRKQSVELVSLSFSLLSDPARGEQDRAS
eukprot:5818385-Lingulodinium_polyedra.AAC.1